MPVEAIEFIHDNIDLTPTLLFSKITEHWQDVDRNQVYSAWSRRAEGLWRNDDDPVASVTALLKTWDGDVDLFDLMLDEGIVAIAWGIKRIAKSLKGKVVEIAMDTTYNTNSAKLELYTIIAEVDNAGFPLAYCFLSTATSISTHKRTNALASFLSALRTTYNINPEFAHLDKDFAEISALAKVWPATSISICWWHMRDALRKRTTANTLSTSKYDPKEAMEEFPFISKTFCPSHHAKLNPRDNEEPIVATQPPPTNPSSLIVKLTLPPGFQWTQPNPTEVTDMMDTDSDEDAEPMDQDTRRQFCPLELRQPLFDMVELHFCAHSSIPGMSAPTKEGIWWWAVKQLWDFCTRYHLPELWAYMWNSWYRPQRWKLWARSQSKTIPRLKTTMICESHWRHIKHDYLTHNHQPRLDYLAWVLMKRLVPIYINQLNTRLTYTGRHRKRATWRKEFKRQWKLCATQSVHNPDKLEYNPRPYLWVCSCPAFIKSRFLICKHLVQKVHPVTPAFFYQVSRERACPIWRHPDLRPIDPPADD
ncbi:hypothetical protein CPB86DRAFT_676043, partial [Serendipita vermifera]